MAIHDDLGPRGRFGSNNTVLNNLSEDSDNGVKQTYSNMKKTHQELFLQPLVPYIIYSFWSSSYENIKFAVMGHR